MNIWINGLSGDVDVINGLNHYIGMKHITPEMFPEFRFLPYVVGFFMLLGMSVAVTGSRKLLMVYLGLTVVGGALAMYDFYKWGYDYGHHLDPKAPIQVPGLSYQPPLFGHKRLLNFDAYSFPDVGGWVVVAAAALAFGVFFAEWWHQRRQTRKKKTAYGVPLILLLSILWASCSSGPEPFKYGTDSCYTCKMGVVDPKFGAELITKKGKVYKFDDVICMNHFLRSGAVEEKDIKRKLVINFEKENDFLDAEQAVFVQDEAIRSPMGSHAAAFADRTAADNFVKKQPGQLRTWKELSAGFQ